MRNINEKLAKMVIRQMAIQSGHSLKEVRAQVGLSKELQEYVTNIIQDLYLNKQASK